MGDVPTGSRPCSRCASGGHALMVYLLAEVGRCFAPQLRLFTDLRRALRGPLLLTRLAGFALGEYSVFGEATFGNTVSPSSAPTVRAPTASPLAATIVFTITFAALAYTDLVGNATHYSLVTSEYTTLVAVGAGVNSSQVVITSLYAGSVVIATTVSYMSETTAAGASQDAFVALLQNSTLVAGMFAGSALLGNYASSATSSLADSTASVTPTADMGLAAVDPGEGVPGAQAGDGLLPEMAETHCPIGYSATGDALCADTDGCSPAPCFPGVPCADVAAPGEGFICGSCPEGHRGDGATCELCELVVRYLPEMSTVIAGEMKRSVTNQLGAAFLGLSEADCVLTQGVVYRWDALLSDGTAFLLDSTTNMRETLTLYLPKNSLTAKTAYSMQLTASLRGNRQVAAAVNTTFQVKSEPLVALIQGGFVQTGAGIPVELDAGVSYDPDGAPGEMTYSWTCMRTDAAAPDPYCRSAADSALLPATLSASLLSLALLGATGEGAQYTLVCQVRKGDRRASASTTVSIREGSLAVPAITPLRQKLAANSKLTLTAQVASLSPETLSLHWSLRPLAASPDTVELAEVAATPLDLTNLVVRADSLMPGGVYLFTLTAEDGHGSAQTTLQVRVNSPPHSGGIAVTPLEGVMAETLFGCQGSGWEDDAEDMPLFYQLRYEVMGADGGWKMLTQWQPFPVFSVQMNAAGLEAHGRLVRVCLYVKDALGATAFVAQDLAVHPMVFADQATEDAFVEAGIGQAAQGVANGQDTSADVAALVSILAARRASSAAARRRALSEAGAEPGWAAAKRQALMEVVEGAWNILPRTTDTVTRMAQGAAGVADAPPAELTEQARAQFRLTAASLVAATQRADPDASLGAQGASALMEGLSSVTLGAVAPGANCSAPVGAEVASAVEVARAIGFSSLQGLVPEEDPVAVCTEMLCTLAQRADLHAATARAPVASPSGAAVSFPGSLAGALGEASASVDVMLVSSAADPHVQASCMPGPTMPGGPLVSSDVTSVSLYNSSGDEVVVSGLEEALVLTLPDALPSNRTALSVSVSVGDPSGDYAAEDRAQHTWQPFLGASCAFWDSVAERYSSEGCASLPNPSPAGATLRWWTRNVSQLVALDAAWVVEHGELLAGCEEVWGAHYPEYLGLDAGRRKYVGVDCQLADPANSVSCWWDWRAQPGGAFRGAGCVLAPDTSCLCTHLTDFVAVQNMELGSLDAPDRVSSYDTSDMKRVNLTQLGRSWALLSVLAILMLGAPVLYICSNVQHNSERLRILQCLLEPARKTFTTVDGVWTWSYVEKGFYAGRSLSLSIAVQAAVEKSHTEKARERMMLNVMAANLVQKFSTKMHSIGRLSRVASLPKQGQGSDRNLRARLRGLANQIYGPSKKVVAPSIPAPARLEPSDELDVISGAALGLMDANLSTDILPDGGVVIDTSAASCRIVPPRDCRQRASQAPAPHAHKARQDPRPFGLAGHSERRVDAGASASAGNAGADGLSGALMPQNATASCTGIAGSGPVVESYWDQGKRHSADKLGSTSPRESDILLGASGQAVLPRSRSRTRDRWSTATARWGTVGDRRGTVGNRQGTVGRHETRGYGAKRQPMFQPEGKKISNFQQAVDIHKHTVTARSNEHTVTALFSLLQVNSYRLQLSIPLAYLQQQAKLQLGDASRGRRLHTLEQQAQQQVLVQGPANHDRPRNCPADVPSGDQCSDLICVEAQAADMRGMEAQTADMRSMEAQTADMTGMETQTAGTTGMEAQTADMRSMEAQIADIMGTEAQTADMRVMEAQATDMRGMETQMAGRRGMEAEKRRVLTQQQVEGGLQKPWHMRQEDVPDCGSSSSPTSSHGSAPNHRDFKWYVSVFKVLIQQLGREGWFQRSHLWHLIFLQHIDGSFDLSHHLARVLRAGETQHDMMSNPLDQFSRDALHESMPGQLLKLYRSDEQDSVATAEEVWATILVLQELANYPYNWTENPQEAPHRQITLRSRSEMFLTYQCTLHPDLTPLMPELKALATMYTDRWGEAFHRKVQENYDTLGGVKKMVDSVGSNSLRRMWSKKHKSTWHRHWLWFKTTLGWIAKAHPLGAIYLVRAVEPFSRSERILIQANTFLLLFAMTLWFYYTKAVNCCKDLRALLTCPDPMHVQAPCLGFDFCLAVKGASAKGFMPAELQAGEFVCDAFPEDSFIGRMWAISIIVGVLTPTTMALSQMFIMASDTGIANHWGTFPVKSLSKHFGPSLTAVMQTVGFTLYAMLINFKKFNKAMALTFVATIALLVKPKQVQAVIRAVTGALYWSYTLVRRIGYQVMGMCCGVDTTKRQLKADVEGARGISSSDP
ncbi:hypothetical protein CYMTET_48565 [Cymbomonas tetramitiformis]|uniref:PKD/REJ-like domain-containing protein n=1 Tax=Cymbomonas tetramitiformis TaxID=36881 RepID=A0AAE0BS11_9CHLO|nr:hypothetical protein CYMTET_48565 [Cymbomonas tetramitiformis]